MAVYQSVTRKFFTTKFDRLTGGILQFFIESSKNRLFILFSYDKEFYLETYILTEKDDFSNEQWYRIDRVKSNLTDITKKIEKDFKSYQLISGNWLHEFSGTRKIRQEEDNFQTEPA